MIAYLKSDFDQIMNDTEIKLEIDFLKLQLKELQRLAYQDDVTHLFNQRKLSLDLDQAILTYEKNKTPFGLLFIDIDHFKQVNDGFGHMIGSSLLVEVAKRITSAVRNEDSVYRYGGDEFVVLCPGLNEEGAFHLGEKILMIIKEKSFSPCDGVEKKLSVSIGISSPRKSKTTKNEILQLADDLMYTAKKNGRGQVCFVN